MKRGIELFLSYLVASPLGEMRETVKHLQGVNTRLFEMNRETLVKLMEAHGKVFVAENRLAHAKKYTEEREQLHQVEVAAQQLAAKAERERVLGLVDAARRQAATEAQRGAFRVLEQLIIDISTGGKA